MRVTPAAVLSRATPLAGPLPTPCLVYPRTDRVGYGRAKTGGRQVMVHRLAWEQVHGPIPPGVTLDHLCRVRACCAVDHLEPVDHRTNCLRGTSPAAQNAAKTECSHGHPLSGANLYVHPDGERGCRACARRRYAEWKARRARLA